MLNPRIALYSPGMVGLGHMRRNLLLVRKFAAKYPEGSFLMITEAREAGIFDFPENVDCLSLPALRKDSSGQCSPRRLKIDLHELIRLRRDVITSALSQFNPDVLIVDHLPRGALGELTQVLELLEKRGTTRFVLGLRDILEEHETVRTEWARAGHEETIERFYEAVWIYGDPAVFDLLREYDLPRSIATRARFTGYLNPLLSGPEGAGDADTLTVKLLDGAPFVLCQVGGGQDGKRIAESFVEATMPGDLVGVLLTGPFMAASERAELCRRAARNPSRIHVLDLISEPAALLSRAHSVITMGGYNSVCEVVAHAKRALVIPRTAPRREQIIRAQRMADLGIVEWLPAEELSTAALSEWMARDAADRTQHHMDMRGLDRASRYLQQVVEGRWGMATPVQPMRALEISA